MVYKFGISEIPETVLPKNQGVFITLKIINERHKIFGVTKLVNLKLKYVPFLAKPSDCLFALFQK